MGGAHTIQNGITHPELFHYIGIFSISGGGEQYEKDNDAALKKATADVKLVYYAYGREDFVVRNADQLKGTLNKYGIPFMLHETDGGHTWINWREYPNDFATHLFKQALNGTESILPTGWPGCKNLQDGKPANSDPFLFANLLENIQQTEFKSHPKTRWNCDTIFLSLIS